MIAIIAILAAIAIPSYRDFARRGQLPEAFTALADYRIKMEQYFQDNRNYGSGVVCANAGGAGAAKWTLFSSGKYFTYSCAVGSSGASFTLTATGAFGLAIGYAYTIDQDNSRVTTLFKNGTSSANCWLVKGDEC